MEIDRGAVQKRPRAVFNKETALFNHEAGNIQTKVRSAVAPPGPRRVDLTIARWHSALGLRKTRNINVPLISQLIFGI